MDSDLNFNSHIKTITSSAYCHLKNTSRTTRFLSKQDTEILVQAFNFGRVDYWCLHKSWQKNQSQSCSSFLNDTKKIEHIIPVLKSLHWIPVCQRIDFKFLLLVYKALKQSQGPSTCFICTLQRTQTPLVIWDRLTQSSQDQNKAK